MKIMFYVSLESGQSKQQSDFTREFAVNDSVEGQM